jgi:transketolase
MTQLAINTIRTLSIDAVQQAKCGHPGTPMALAPLIYTVADRVMRFDPEDPFAPFWFRAAPANPNGFGFVKCPAFEA